MNQVFRTNNGVIITQQSAHGFTSLPTEVPSTWITPGSEDWFKGFALSVQVVSVGDAKSKVLLQKSGTDESVVVFEGDAIQAQGLSQQIQQMWMQSNGFQAAITPVASTTVLPQAKAHSVAPEPAPAAVPVGASAAVAPVATKKGAKWAAALSMVALLAGTGYGTYWYMSHQNKPLEGAPALDLSKMSIDDLAKIEGDPVFVKNVQSEMMAAVGAGQEAAKAKSSEVQSNHINALKSMGLDPGTSMQSAAACLANL